MKLTVDDVTRLFNVSEKTVYRWIKSSELPAYRVNNQYRFNRVDLLEWAAAHRVNVSTGLVDEAPDPEGAELPGLAEALATGGIHYRVGGHDKESVLREIVGLLQLPERIERESLFQILLAREEMGSTGIGDGIAIPHARNPIVMNITRPSVTLCFLETAGRLRGAGRPARAGAVHPDHADDPRAPPSAVAARPSRCGRSGSGRRSSGTPRARRSSRRRAGPTPRSGSRRTRGDAGLDRTRMRLLVISLGLLSAGAAGAAAVAAPVAGGWPVRRGVRRGGGARRPGRRAARSCCGPASIEQVHLPWTVPYGSFFLEADPLSAFFLVPIFLLTGLAAVYGTGYLKAHEGGRPTGAAWASYNALTASMVLVVLARNAVLFLMAWEVMAVTSFLLVARDNERAEVRRAGVVYLVAGHLGTTALFLFFLLLGREAGSLDFDRLAAVGAGGAPQAALLFALALIGFGTKAGLVPLHVWLPEAHPAAPSHVSAVMSGVMIKTGVYGIVRDADLARPAARLAWAWTLIGVGLLTGVLGALLALAQRDLKRVLAYSSIENSGIILTGSAWGCSGRRLGRCLLIVLGYGGALLHVLNHALFKGLLFLGAGSVQCGAHTLDLEQLGGLQRRMPWTGAAFLVGAAAICGLPPLNGFVSEFTVLLGALHGVRLAGPGAAAPAFAVICGLGADRRAGRRRLHPGLRHRLPGPAAQRGGRAGARVGARACSGRWASWRRSASAPGWVRRGCWPCSGRCWPAGRSAAGSCRADLAQLAATLRIVALAGALLGVRGAGAGGVAAARRWRGARCAPAPTWDCGYARTRRRACSTPPRRSRSRSWSSFRSCASGG